MVTWSGIQRLEQKQMLTQQWPLLPAEEIQDIPSPFPYGSTLKAGIPCRTNYLVLYTSRALTNG